MRVYLRPINLYNCSFYCNYVFVQKINDKEKDIDAPTKTKLFYMEKGNQSDQKLLPSKFSLLLLIPNTQFLKLMPQIMIYLILLLQSLTVPIYSCILCSAILDYHGILFFLNMNFRNGAIIALS